uniref:AAA family ATPase n=1 Tax=Candidatus Ventrenecus sp. TaxID=3085654 RepID=UPI003FEF4AC3
MKKKIGKSLCLFSGKGGVGKTILTLNLAAIYSQINKHVLIVDLDLSSGGIALATNKVFDKTIYNFVDDYNNNRFKDFNDYVVKYNENIDIMPSPKDPRQASKIDSKYIEILLDKAMFHYDMVLIDTNHNLNELNLVVLDAADNILFVIENDPMDLKNMKSLLSIFKDLEKTNYKILLNNSRDPFKKYFTLYDMKTIIKNNIDYEISSEFFLKNMDSYVMNGEIPMLQPKAPNIFNKDYTTMMNLAVSFLGGDNNEQN